MTFFAFQTPPAIIGVLLFALYFGPYVRPVVTGRAELIGRALGLQLVIMCILCVLSFFFSERGPDLAGVILFSLLFLPIAFVAACLVRIRNWILPNRPDLT